MSWVQFIRPTSDKEVYNPYSLGIDNDIYRDFANDDLKDRPKAEIVVPLAGLGGYRPSIEQLWRATALLWLIFVTSYM